jgi:hypothetical protein
VTTLDNLGQHSDGTLIAQAQAQKEVTSNALDNLLANATQKRLAVALSDLPGSPTLSEATLGVDAFFGHAVFDLGGTPSAALGLLLVPAGGAHLFAVTNRSGIAVAVAVDGAGSPAGAQAVVPAAGAKLLHSDGANVAEISSGAGAQPYDLALFLPTVAADVLLAQVVAARAYTLPAALAGSRARAATPPASGEPDTALSLRRNGAAFGTLTFAALDDAGVFAAAGPTSFAPGDLLQIFGPALGSPAPSPALAGVAVTFRSQV